MSSVSITATIRTGGAPLEIQFTGVTVGIGQVVQWLWDWGDGTYSYEKNPIHTYIMPGIYTVTLTVVTEDGRSYTRIFHNYIRVYERIYAAETGQIDVSLTDKCYWLPVKAGDGYGVAEFKDGNNPGADWIWPTIGIGARVIELEGEEYAYVIDEKTQRVYLINDPDVLYDRVGQYGSSGNQIIAEIHPRSYAAPEGMHKAVKHVEHNIYFDPEDTDNANTDGFDDEGFQAGTRINLEMVKDRKLSTVWREAQNVPKDGNLHFQQEEQAQNIQTRIKVFGAAWLCTRIQELHEIVDRMRAPNENNQTETEYQMDILGYSVFRVSRNAYYPLQNMLTGSDVTGSYSSLVRGPDGELKSALRLVAGGLSDALQSDLNNDFSLLCWVKGLTTAMVSEILWDIDNLQVSLLYTAGAWFVQINDGVNAVVSDQIAFDPTAWNHIGVCRSGLYWLIYYNGVLQGAYPMTSAEQYSGASCVVAQTNAISIFDPIVIATKSLAANSMSYYYNQVLKNTETVLPVMQ